MQVLTLAKSGFYKFDFYTLLGQYYKGVPRTLKTKQ